MNPDSIKTSTTVEAVQSDPNTSLVLGEVIDPNNLPKVKRVPRLVFSGGTARRNPPKPPSKRDSHRLANNVQYFKRVRGILT